MPTLTTENQTLIKEALDALRTREFYAAFPEHPKAYGEDGDSKGQEAFKNHLGKPFQELKYEESTFAGNEISPYTQKTLGITYPQRSVENLLSKAAVAMGTWRKVSAEKRADMLLDSLNRFKNRFFEVAYATMHTTGQGYMMAFQAGGPHAADRAMEAIALGLDEQKKYPENNIWDKPMGKFNITLDKSWKNFPKGISLAIGCSTFPIWNSAPGIYASLVTGNPVIVKPHPGAILPLAIIVAEIRNVLRENNLDPDTCQLAIDSVENPVAKILAENPQVKIIDFTGNSRFGGYLEGLAGKTVFTEKTGVNSVLLHSTTNADEMAANLAFSVCLYSGQMCTAPQNFFIPESGIKTTEGTLSFDEVAKKICDNISGLCENPKAGPFVLGAIQNPATCDRVNDIKSAGKKILLESKEISNPMFPGARTISPLVLEISGDDKEFFSSELFGPVVLLIRTKNIEEATQMAADLASEHGAISCAAYTTDSSVREMITDAMGMAATPVSFNLFGGIYVNQNAGFSDFHVTGGNPAGNASFTDAAFVSGRFTRVGFREPK